MSEFRILRDPVNNYSTITGHDFLVIKKLSVHCHHDNFFFVSSILLTVFDLTVMRSEATSTENPHRLNVQLLRETRPTSAKCPLGYLRAITIIMVVDKQQGQGDPSASSCRRQDFGLSEY